MQDRGNVLYQDQSIAIYCNVCEAILIEYQKRVIEYNLYNNFWSENGELTIGETEFIESHSDGATSPYCSICGNETPYYVKLGREVFLLILKSCYRHARDKHRHIDKDFKIELKPQVPDGLLMISPTLQEIKEAITEELI